MAGRSIEHDVGQLVWVGFPGPRVDADLRARISAGAVGGVIVFKRNLVIDANGNTDLDALCALNAELHELGRAAPDPLLIAVDQEGGRVQRVRAPATVWPPMLRLEGAEVEVAVAVGAAMGRELAALGFDVDFAPVLDVHTNDANPIIGDRAFATDPTRVAELGMAFARGLARSGILACGKHFPGHGDTVTDSHLALPRLVHDLERLERVELAPFRRAAAAALPMLMTAHVVFDAIDPERPATLSAAVIQQLLRDRIGYTGVVVSDDFDMKAIADHHAAGEAAVAAVAAGCDVLLACNDRATQRAIFDALVQGAETDDTLRERISVSATRVRDMKRAHFTGDRPSCGREWVGHEQHRLLAERLSAG